MLFAFAVIPFRLRLKVALRSCIRSALAPFIILRLRAHLMSSLSLSVDSLLFMKNLVGILSAISVSALNARFDNPHSRLVVRPKNSSALGTVAISIVDP